MEISIYKCQYRLTAFLIHLFFLLVFNNYNRFTLFTI